MFRKTLLVSLALGALLAICPRPALAVPALPAGFGPDDGTYLWMADSAFQTLELYDSLGTNPGTTFGLYFESAPEQLIPIFGPGQQGALATVHMSSGVIFSNLVVTGSFDTAPYFAGDSIGFYLQIDTGIGAPLTVHSLPVLNEGGIDGVTTHPSDAGQYVLSFEVEGEVVATHLVSGLTPHLAGNPGGGGVPFPQGDPIPGTNPVPEPESWLVFLVGLALVIGGVERQARAKAAVEA